MRSRSLVVLEQVLGESDCRRGRASDHPERRGAGGIRPQHSAEDGGPSERAALAGDDGAHLGGGRRFAGGVVGDAQSLLGRDSRVLRFSRRGGGRSETWHQCVVFEVRSRAGGSALPA